MIPAATAWDFRFVREADWLVLWLLGIAAGAWLLYRREGAGIPRWMRILMASLRASALGLVLALLFEPMIVALKSRSQEATVAVLVDTSRSMGITANEYLDPEDRLAAGRYAGLVDKDAKSGSLPAQTEEKLKALTRAQTAEGILNHPDLGLLKKLAEVHRVKLYTFDAGVATWTSGSRLPPTEGNSTRLGDVLRNVASSLRGQILAGIVVLTDGKTNAGEDPEVSAKALGDQKPGVPVYAVGLGESSPPKDIALANLAANPVAIKGGDPMTFRARLTATGFAGQKALVTLSKGDTEVDRQSVALPKDGEEMTVTLTHKPEEEGTFTYRLAVAPMPGELVIENNALTQAVKVISDRVKICYLDERPRWEYRKLKNFLVRNAKLYTSSCLLLSADDTFPQEGSKPIPEFYKDYKDLAENVDVLILGDLDPSHLTQAQMEGIVRFCESGGGVIFEAGEEYMPCAYRGTPLAKLLPLRQAAENWDRRVWLEAITESFGLKLTARGESHPLMQFVDQPGDENRRFWEALQGQYWFFPLEQLKPVAVPLAVHPVRKTKDGQPYPLAVAMPYGAGQTLFLAFDSTWRWSFGDPSDSNFSRFWGRVVQNMASNRLLAGTNHATVSTDRSEYALGDRVFILARVVDASFEPLKQDTVRVLIQPKDQPAQPVALTRNPASGEFEGTWTAARQGDHEISLDPASAMGIESRHVAFGVRAITAEFQEPRMDRQALESVAKLSGGKFYTPRDVSGLVAQIKDRSETLVREEKQPLWDSPWALCVLVGLLSVEWILRKWMRLM